ncbi:MAG: hypothetical protein ABIS36_15950 [Chryseolinea sp.]
MPVATPLPFTVYGTDPFTPGDFYIPFDLSERQEVLYSIVDTTGRSLLTKVLDEVLNQTYQVEPNLNAGIYIQNSDRGEFVLKPIVRQQLISN